MATGTPNPDTDHAILRDVVAIDENNIWAVGDYSAEGDFGVVRRSLAMHHDGNTWNIVPSPNPACVDGTESVNLFGVDAAGPDDVWAVGLADLVTVRVVAHILLCCAGMVRNGT